MRLAFGQRFAFWRPRSRLPFAVLFKKFQSILDRNNHILEKMADMGDKLGGEYVFDRHYIEHSAEELSDMVFKLVSDFSLLNREKNSELFIASETVRQGIAAELSGKGLRRELGPRILPLAEIGLEHCDEVGSKLANLGEIHNRLGLNVPEGFAITTAAFADLVAPSAIAELLPQAARLWQDRDEAGLRRLAAEVHQRILVTPLPGSLASAIDSACRELTKKHGGSGVRFAVRSSATWEDGGSSFAGQHLTLLNVPPSQVAEAYRSVVASLFSFAAWRYRLERGYEEDETAMAVGCQLLVEGTASGVLHTCAPDRPSESMVIESIWGLCAPVVGGECATDAFILDRIPPYRSLATTLAAKTRQATADPRGGTCWQEVATERQHLPSLAPDQLQTLAETAMTLEGFFKRPLQIEWTFATGGDLTVLQVRPLSRWTSRLAEDGRDSAPQADATVVFADRGVIVQCGVATGRVVRVDSDRDLERFPHGGILVARHTSPRYSAVMGKVRGIITDFGSSAGHMATIAREFRVPTVVNTTIATAALHDGDRVTLDATHNVVYEGEVATVTGFIPIEEEIFEDSAEYRLLRRVLRHVTPLNLLAPQSENFLPSACRTYHDITRYIHEKAVEALIHLSDNHGASHSSAPRKLTAELPLGLLVINAGDGLDGAADDPEVSVEQVTSLPLAALLAGLSTPGMWSTMPLSVNLNSFMASFTRTFTTSLAGPKDIGRNLAVVMRNYLNINLRLGYHFTTIDAYIADNVNDNYIYFRFLGGVTELIRRSRRAICIAKVLERYDFRVETHGDIVLGRLKKQPAERMRQRMTMLGALLGFTRQLDAQMHSDSDVAHHAEVFIKAFDDHSAGDDHDHSVRQQPAPPAHSR